MSEIALSGCSPDTLIGYLKALGVLRLVAEQQDPGAALRWDGDEPLLTSRLDTEGLVDFFLHQYRPTPVLAPWNKDSGFYKKESSVAAIERSEDERFDQMRASIRVAREVMHEFGWKTEPGKAESKARFLATLRARLPDPAMRWLDAVAALGDQPVYMPLFGTGGADGRFEFAKVFADSLGILFGLTGRKKLKGAEAGLRTALFGEASPGATIPATGGLLAPASVDAPNAAQGFIGDKRLNPWEFVLSLEGALLMAGSVARRWGRASGRLAAFPFTVEGCSAGHPSAGDEDARGEIWLPLWDRPMGLRELTHLFREGRAEWQRRQATTAADMGRAIATLGVSRGLREFRRFGIQGRGGSSYLAVPLGRWEVVDRPQAHLLAQLDDFLTSLRIASRQDSARPLVQVLRKLEDAILNYTAHGDRTRLLRVLFAAARAELVLAERPAVRSRGIPRPLAPLSTAWAYHCDDGSAEFAIASAVASLRPAGAEGPGELRRHLEPVELTRGRWSWAESLGHEVVWTGRELLDDMARILERRLIDAERHGVELPLDGYRRIVPGTVTGLLDGSIDLERTARLVEALSLIDWRREGSIPMRPAGGHAGIPATYAVLKLALLGRPLYVGREHIMIRADAMIPALLRAGEVWRAVLQAAHRLRAAGLSVRGIPRRRRGRVLVPDRELGRRLLAALLVPVDDAPLLRLVTPDEQTAEAGEEQTHKEERHESA